jgi:two-component system response regulator AtoC
MQAARPFDFSGQALPLQLDYFGAKEATISSKCGSPRSGSYLCDDLYFRLNVVRIVMPPLRERKEHIPILVRGFLRHFCKQNQKPLLDLAPDAMDGLLAYDWPRNIRELRTAIEHGVVMATGKQITLRDLPMTVRQAGSAKLPGGVSPTAAFGEKTSPLDLHETERRLIAQALAATNGNVTAAAKKLGISRRTLHRKINEMNLGKASAKSTGQL